MSSFVILGVTASQFKSGLNGDMLGAKFVFDFAQYCARYEETNLYIKGNQYSCTNELVMFHDLGDLKAGHFRGKRVYVYASALEDILPLKNCFLDCEIGIFISETLKTQSSNIRSVLSGNKVDLIEPGVEAPDDQNINQFIKSQSAINATSKLMEVESTRLEDPERRKVVFVADLVGIRKILTVVDTILNRLPDCDIVILADERARTFIADWKKGDSVVILPLETTKAQAILAEVGSAFLVVYPGIGKGSLAPLLSFVAQSGTPWMSSASIVQLVGYDSAPDFYCGIDPSTRQLKAIEDTVLQVLSGLRASDSSIRAKWFGRLKKSQSLAQTLPVAQLRTPSTEIVKKPEGGTSDKNLYEASLRASENASVINVIWIGRFEFVGGYGEVARGYLQAMEAANMRYLCIDIEKKKPIGKTTGIFWEHDPETRSYRVKGPALLVINDLPTKYGWFKGEGFISRVGCTLFETDSFPVNWVEGLSFVDEMWIPTEFNKETFKNSGVPEEKLSVLQYSIDTDFFVRNARAENEPVRLLYIVSNLNRKDPGLLLRAYFKAFSCDDNVVLTIKTRMTEERFKAAMEAHLTPHFTFDDPRNPKVRFVTGTISNDGIRNLYEDTDLYVTTERAKGWDYPAMEAMAMEVPCLSLDWSGSEFLNDANAFLVPMKSNLTTVHSSQVDNAEMYFGHKWADVDETKVVEVLKYAVTNKEERLRKGKQCRIDALKYCAPEIGKQMRRILEDQVVDGADEWATLYY